MSDHYNLGFLHASRSMPVQAPAKPKRAFEEYSAGYADGLSERPMKTYDSSGKLIGVVALNNIAPSRDRPLDSRASHGASAKRGVKEAPLVPGMRTHTPITLATREAKVSRKQKGLTAALTNECLIAREAELRELEQSLHLREQEIAKREAELTRQLKAADTRAKEALASQRHHQLKRLRQYRQAVEKKYAAASFANEAPISNHELMQVAEATRITHVSHHAITLTRMLSLVDDLLTLHESEDATDALVYAKHSLTLQLDGMKETLNG